MTLNVVSLSSENWLIYSPKCLELSTLVLRT